MLPTLCVGTRPAISSLSIPAQSLTCLILNHPPLKEVLLFFQVHDFAHPGEGRAGTGVLFLRADLG